MRAKIKWSGLHATQLLQRIRKLLHGAGLVRQVLEYLVGGSRSLRGLLLLATRAQDGHWSLHRLLRAAFLSLELLLLHCCLERSPESRSALAAGPHGANIIFSLAKYGRQLALGMVFLVFFAAQGLCGARLRNLLLLLAVHFLMYGLDVCQNI